jgi:hypothetical protein
MVKVADYWTYESERGIPLVYNGPPPLVTPILTVESYCKWYSLYAVHPDGQVRPAPHESYVALEVSPLATVTHTWSDHVPYPPALQAIAEHLGMEWDENSLDMIHGRYYREHTDLLDEDDPQDWVRHRIVKEDGDVAGGRPQRTG